MPKVLLLCEYATLNGGERSMLATLDSVRRAGFSVSAIAQPVGPLADGLRAKGIGVLPFVATDSTGRRFPKDELRDELRDLLTRRRPHLLHANSLSMGRLCGPVAAELGIPSIAHLRDIIKLSSQAVADLNCHTRLLAVSEATRQSHAAGGLAAEKIHVLYNGVDLDRFHPRPKSGYLHRELALPPEIQLVGTIGQIGVRKGLDVLARAAVLLKDELPNVHYLVVGQRWSDKPESRKFEADLRTTGTSELAGRMHFLGFRDDVERIFKELTLLAHPARQEPLGRVLLEAAASGVAVVATDVGGTREIFPPDSHAARLVPPDDADALAAAMLDLIGNKSLRARIAAAARRRAEEAFNAEHAAETLVEHYTQLLAPV